MSGTAQRVTAVGVCGCSQHADHWDRPRHWTLDEVAYLEAHYGRMSDTALSAKLGRSITGIHLKAKRLGQRKKDAGFTATQVADIFGVDNHLPARWVRRGLMRGQRAGYTQGSGRVLFIQPLEVERFIREHGEWVDVDKMPESWYGTLAKQHRWYSLPDVERLTGHEPKSLAKALRAGLYAGRKRWGTWWMVPASELPRIQAATTTWRRTHLDHVQRERSQRLRDRKRQRVQAQAA